MSQEDAKSLRKSLKTLQHVAADRENLVGRPSKSLKHQLSQESPVEVEVKRKHSTVKELKGQDSPVDVDVKRKHSATKETQANLNNKISVDDLTNPKGASDTYWKILADKRQIALQETLDENERLRKIINDLREENVSLKQMLEEANSFVEVIKEELANSDKDDTGIDVNDVSTADETLDGADEETVTKAKSSSNKNL